MATMYTWDDIRKHNTDKSCWVVLYGRVLDVTKFLDVHPGGLDPINDQGGYDITNMFESIGHSKDAKKISEKYVIGVLDPASKEPVVKRKEPVGKQAPLNKFSTKEDPVIQKLKIVGLLVFLAFAGFFVHSLM